MQERAELHKTIWKIANDERIGYLIQLEGRYARLDMLC